jgi:hypothetical protein
MSPHLREVKKKKPKINEQKKMLGEKEFANCRSQKKGMNKKISTASFVKKKKTFDWRL